MGGSSLSVEFSPKRISTYCNLNQRLKERRKIITKERVMVELKSKEKMKKDTDCSSESDVVDTRN